MFELIWNDILNFYSSVRTVYSSHCSSYKFETLFKKLQTFFRFAIKLLFQTSSSIARISVNILLESFVIIFWLEKTMSISINVIFFKLSQQYFWLLKNKKQNVIGNLKCFSNADCVNLTYIYIFYCYSMSFGSNIQIIHIITMISIFFLSIVSLNLYFLHVWRICIYI